VAAYEVLSAPRVKGPRTLPRWEWHNRHFGLAVGVVYLDTICLLPACFLFVLHSQGQDAYIILKQLESGDLGAIIFHVVIAILLGLVQVTSIVHTSRQLHVQQDALEAHTSTALPFVSRCLVGAKMVLDGIFFIMLLVIAIQTGNSGPIICVITALATRSVFILYAYQLYKGVNAEAFLTRWRQACVIQCFFTYAEFWVSFIVYLLRRRYGVDFFASVDNMGGSQRALIAVALATMIASIINYICLLYYHARCMSGLDEMGGFAQLDGDSGAASLYLTRRTRVTNAGAEMTSPAENKEQ
jgi:hypothetical protein